jgi:EmrB/QacA subfamily drug resistance transporter
MTDALRPQSAIRWWTLAIVSVATFMLMLDLSVVAIALPGIEGSLHASFSQLQWVFDAYALTLAAFLVTAGSVADRSGRKRIFLGGLILFTAASLACGLAGSITILNVSRGLQGVGAAILFAVGPALLGHEFHGRERAMAFSVFGASLGIAVATGPLIGGALTNGPGWRWIFFLNVPVGLVAAALAARQLRESRLPSGHSIDIAGMIAFTASLAAIVLAIIRGNDNGWFSASNLTMYAISVVCMAAFVVLARRRGERAMFDLGMFRNPTFVGLSLVAFLANCAGFPSIFIETSFMQNLLGYSAWQAGLRFLPLTLAMFFFGAVAGALTGKVPFRIMMALACASLGCGLLLSHLAGADSSWTALIPALIVTGAGFGMFNPTRAALAIGVVEPARAGVASGINETFQQVGAAFGIAVGGAFFENRVINSFIHSNAGSQLGGQARTAGSAISAGAINATARSAGQAVGGQVLSDGRTAFTIGFHDAMTLCGILALTAALIAIASLRNKDLHASALTGIPPEIPETTDEHARVVALNPSGFAAD